MSRENVHARGLASCRPAVRRALARGLQARAGSARRDLRRAGGRNRARGVDRGPRARCEGDRGHPPWAPPARAPSRGPGRDGVAEATSTAGSSAFPGGTSSRREAPPTHHVHAVEHGSVEWLKHVHFRDHLRTHPEDAQSYAKLKRDLAARYPEDRDAYTEGKSPFVAAVLRRASRGSRTPARG